MIRSLTIIENITEDGRIEYSANGNLPLDSAGSALILIAYNAEKPKKEGIILDEGTPKSDQ